MKKIARFVLRDDPNEPACLILGAAINPSPLKPGYVYEITEILDTLTIREVGPSAINGYMNDPGSPDRPYITWGHSVDDILISGTGWHLMTPEEWRSLEV